MAKVEVDLDVQDNSLDNSNDKEQYLGIVAPYSSADCESSGLETHTFYDNTEEEDNNSSYSYRDLSGGLTYKLVQMTPENSTITSISPEPPSHLVPSGDYYVISNAADVFGGSVSKKVIRRQPLKAKAVTAKKRDDKRRATHNEVERRRRDKINSWISKIAGMVPNSGHPDSASKGGILAKACDYITELTDKQKKLEKLEMDNDKLVMEVLRLNQELVELRKENSIMRTQLNDNNSVVSNAQNQRPKGQKS
ncbi:upstream stimulatory factor 2 isoform X2 [Leptidea sinapis]|uniref:upstream stimulatory factor 2 isoform X2 n=1 Tax=Leptidea sinapis TaxID=189913 RepID=UPI0021C3D6B7|nr:upstream stimulatory factor 2 isoform X2 [Leptidea sinapis]